MIIAGTPEARKEALDHLLPMQYNDFYAMFKARNTSFEKGKGGPLMNIRIPTLFLALALALHEIEMKN